MKTVPSGWRSWPVHLAALLVCGLLLALGSWQLARRAWKRDLIARVEARVHAPPEAAPSPAQWARQAPRDFEYRHVRLHGVWLAGRATLVAGVSVLGSGYWQLVPLRLDDGSLVLVNRGFLSAPVVGTPDLPGNGVPVTLTGLLRLSEPGGRFLRHNDPAHARWYSRDVEAIAHAQGLATVAPYFVDTDTDAEANASPAAQLPPGGASDDGERLVRLPASGTPVGGLTVVAFPNNHLGYALTWYGLAAMTALGWLRWVREHHGMRREGARQGVHEQHRDPVDREQDRV